MEQTRFNFIENYLEKEIIICDEDCNKQEFCVNHNLKNRNIENSFNEIRKGEFVLINNKPNLIYVVLPRDTLQTIAQKFNTSVENIIKKNNIQNIFIGQQLYI